MSRWLIVVVGGILLIISLGFLIHGARAARAQDLYFQAKYGPESRDLQAMLEGRRDAKELSPSNYQRYVMAAEAALETTLARCRQASKLYPYNYHFCALVAEAAYNRAQDRSGEEARRFLEIARLWCERGLALNRYKSKLRWLESKFLWSESKTQAIQYWEEYTSWNFWEPYNHYWLAALRAKAGEVEKAEKEIRWVQGSAYYAQTLDIVNQAKESARKPLPAP